MCFRSQLGTTIDSCTFEAIIDGATAFNEGIFSSWLFMNQESCIFSTTAASAVENPVAVKTSRSIQRGEAVLFRYKVKPPNRLPFFFSRLKVKLQFVSDDVSELSQKKLSLDLLAWVNGQSSTPTGTSDDKYRPKPSNPTGSRHSCNMWQNSATFVHEFTVSAARRMLISLAITWR